MKSNTLFITLFSMIFATAIANANCTEDETSANTNDQVGTTAAKSMPVKVDKGANFKVAEMICTSCQEKITQALTKNKTVKNVAFDAKTRTVSVTVSEPTETASLIKSFDSIGFEAEFLGTI